MCIPLFIRRYLPASILIVVALGHVYQTRTWDRSAWGTGCGFGMFSTVDSHATRIVRCYASMAGGVEQLEVPAAISLRARAQPNSKHLDALANTLLEEAVRRWPTTTGVKVEIWRTNFHAASQTVSLRRLNETVVEVNADNESQRARTAELMVSQARSAR